MLNKKIAWRLISPSYLLNLIDMNKLERLIKYANGGKIAKFLNPFGPVMNTIGDLTNLAIEQVEQKREREAANLAVRNYQSLKMVSGTDSDQASQQMLVSQQTGVTTTKLTPSVNLQWNNDTNRAEGNVEIQKEEYTPGISQEEQQEKPININKGNASWKPTAEQSQMIGGAAVAAINAVDGATMGDKNFSASSQAIDAGVHMASGALIKSGNPYAMAAGVGLEAINWVTKAGGKNVQGYDVDIKNSGYGNLGHMESEAGRIWDNWSGATDRKLAKRNEQARMALAAADISESQAFEQEARANSITNVLQQNLIALAGGIDTSLLAS